MRYLAVICFMVASLTGALAQMTHEETVVRTAYAKFAYAVEQRAISELALEANGRPVHKENIGKTSSQRLAAAEVSFTLRDFVVGDMADILTRKVTDLVTPAQGERLRIVGANYNYSESSGLGSILHWFELYWQSASGVKIPPEALTMTVADAYRTLWEDQAPHEVLQRYASYTVTASYQGETIGPYKAMFIFGQDAKGNEVIEPADPTTDNTGLATALHVQLFPDAFVTTRLRTYPVVENWISANQMNNAECSVGQHDVCCDLAKIKCSLGSADVAAALSKPYSPLYF